MPLLHGLIWISMNLPCWNMIKLFSFDSLASENHKEVPIAKKSVSRTSSAQHTRIRHQSKCNDKDTHTNVGTCVFKEIYLTRRPGSSQSSGFGKGVWKQAASLCQVPLGKKDLKQPDPSYKLILDHIKRLFPQVEVNQDSIWLFQDPVDKNYSALFSQCFFSETECILPLSRCCNSAIRVVFSQPGRVECLKCRLGLGQFAIVSQVQYDEQKAKQLFRTIRRKWQESSRNISHKIVSHSNPKLRRYFGKLRPQKIQSGHGTMVLKLYWPEEGQPQ